jgi:hypothetical protein
LRTANWRRFPNHFGTEQQKPQDDCCDDQVSFHTHKRDENERAWKEPATDLLANGCNFDRKNPSAKEDTPHLPPAQLAKSILAKERRITEILSNVKALLTRRP